MSHRVWLDRREQGSEGVGAGRDRQTGPYSLGLELAMQDQTGLRDLPASAS